MLRSFSPPVQRAIALALLVSALSFLILAVLMPLASGISDNLDLLARQRDEEARVRAILDEPPPQQGQLLDAASWIRAADGAAAARALTVFMTAAGARRGVQVSVNADSAPSARPPIMFPLAFTATGEQGAVLAFIGELEAGHPLLRFRRLALQRQAGVPTPPAGPATSSIASQSPNLTDPMIQQDMAPDAAAGGNMTQPAAQATMLRAEGVILALWGGR